MAEVTIAMLGCGGMSGSHARQLSAMDEVDVVACVDVNEEIVNGYIERNLAEVEPQPSVHTDLDAMLAEVKPDGVVIASPHTLHFEHGMKCLEAGCHVLMEKPMVTSADHAYEMAAKVEESGKVFIIGYNTSCSPEFGYLREQIRNNTFGNLELVIGYITQGWMKATEGMWRQKPELSGGGQAYDSGAHLLNSLCWSVESNVAEVFAFVDNHGTAVDINSSINIKFESGVMASIVVSGNCPSGGGTHMAFIFDDGRVEIDGWGGGWIRVWKGGSQIKYPPITEPANNPDKNFIDSILGRGTPRTTPTNGIIQSELMDAIYESAETGQPAKPKRRG
ncbi:MAG: Gfo/Idh/MocA family oxidoreductase [Planctomycetota bacterium]|jgi:predicted dehydrogenase|nr:Gfo/Idh/MocA family oxidoreductase [Planctomycetota bacterium]MDP7251610.1 Gfo/Idh/MocA family oxidoreductase [Planctomycetota bacterium]